MYCVPRLDQTSSSRLLVSTPNFTRSRKKLLRKKKICPAKLRTTLAILRANPADPTLSSHLVRAYKHDPNKYYTSRIDFSYRILWYYDPVQNIVLAAIGPHDGSLGVY